jgi:hypothetical protein
MGPTSHPRPSFRPGPAQCHLLVFVETGATPADFQQSQPCSATLGS